MHTPSLKFQKYGMFEKCIKNIIIVTKRVYPTMGTYNVFIFLLILKLFIHLAYVTSMTHNNVIVIHR